MEAIALNPLIPMGESAKRVMDELLVAHQRYLPQFAEKIKDLQQTVQIKDTVVNQLLKEEQAH